MNLGNEYQLNVHDHLPISFNAINLYSWIIITQQPIKLIFNLCFYWLFFILGFSLHGNKITWVLLFCVPDDMMEGAELAVRDVADLLHAEYAIVTGKLQCGISARLEK